ncbi:TPA: hypothetical protein ACGMX7_001921 [Streptococcus agalactiae]
MSQIKLTPEELRISAQKYTTGSQSITDVLTVLTQEQAVEDINQQLLKVADVVEQTDSDIASQINK